MLNEEFNTTMKYPDYAQLITESQQKLFAYIYSMLGRNAASWDVLQESNLVLWRKQNDFQPGSNFDAWAFSIARFQVLAHLRDRKRDPLELLTPELLEALAEESEEEMHHFDERLIALQHCKSQLKSKNRRIVELYYEKNMPLKDVSASLSSSVNAIKQALLRVRRSLKQCIKIQLKNTTP